MTNQRTKHTRISNQLHTTIIYITSVTYNSISNLNTYMCIYIYISFLGGISPFTSCLQLKISLRHAGLAWIAMEFTILAMRRGTSASKRNSSTWVTKCNTMTFTILGAQGTAGTAGTVGQMRNGIKMLPETNKLLWKMDYL